MQQYSGPAASQNNRHGTGRSRTRIQIDDGLMDGFLCIILQNLIGKIGITEAPAAPGSALLTAAVFFRDDL